MATIDERLDALTHTAELLAGMQIETEKLVQTLLKAQTRTEQSLTRMEQGLNRLRKYASIIAHDHEVRIQLLEKLEQDNDDEKEI
jgi:hypothetical protein